VDGTVFRPHSADGLGKGAALALLAHILLVVALALGVSWRTRSHDVLEAEVWAEIPQTAAEQAAPPPPPPAAPPETTEAKPEPTVEPKQEPKVEPKAEPERPADIVTKVPPKVKPKPEPKPEPKQEPKAKPEPKVKPKPEPKPVPKPEPKVQPKPEPKPKTPPAPEKKPVEKPADKPAPQPALSKAQLEAQRKANLQRMMNALGSGSLSTSGNGSSAAGTAPRSAGPSSSYAGRLRARIIPNIVFTETISGNPTVFVEIRCAPDGRILSKRLLDPSNNPAWDAAVLRAIDRTESLPMDENGRLPDTVFQIGISPRDR